MTLPTIGEDTDPIAFITSLLMGYTKDSNGTVIDLVSSFPHSIEGVPTVIVSMDEARIQPLNIPPTIYRWYTPMTIYVWETNLRDRFRVEGHIRDRIYSLTYPYQQLAENYVWMYVKTARPYVDAMTFGTPIYASAIALELIYDLPNPPLVKTPP